MRFLGFVVVLVALLLGLIGLLFWCYSTPSSVIEEPHREGVRVAGSGGTATVRIVVIDGAKYVVAIGGSKVAICPAINQKGVDTHDESSIQEEQQR